MSVEQNKAIMRRYYTDAFGKGNLALATEMTDAQYVNHGSDAPPGGWPRGPEGTRAIITAYRGAFPDLQFTVDDQVAEGDKVVTRWTGRGTNTGELMGMPPTGKKAVVTGISIERFSNGKIAESWVWPAKPQMLRGARRAPDRTNPRARIITTGSSVGATIPSP